MLYGEDFKAYTTSSVATFPVAPGEYGHPPRPPMEESMVRTPADSAAKTLAIAMPKVSWNC